MENNSTKKNAKRKFTIAISGAAAGPYVKPAQEAAQRLGRALAKNNCITITGATTGTPHFVAQGAKEEGGIVIGFSPAASVKEHTKVYRLPTNFMDVVVYTGFDYSGRNLLLSRSSDANIIISGRMGTLNEFTIAFEDKKLIGVLEGSGGTTDWIPDIVEKAKRGPGDIIYESEPETLVKEIIKELKKSEFNQS